MKLVSLALLAACGGSPKTPSSAPPSPAAHSFTIGTLTAFAVKDGDITVPNDGTVFGIDHAPADVTPGKTIDLSIQPLLVKTADRVLLFDTGAADASFARAGVLPRSLAQANVTPDQVTDIFISHHHPDHVGGLVAKGALAFPKAKIHLSKPEWTAMQADADSKSVVAVISAAVDAFEPGAELLPEVTAVPTPGHTPGHSSYDIHAGGEHLLYIGDVAHHSVISVQHPDWKVQFDAGDYPAAIAMRTQLLAKLAAEHTHVFAVHFPWPGLGHIADGKWVAD